MADEQRFTPGPYHIDGAFNTCIRAQDGRFIAVTTELLGEANMRQEDEANARLLATSSTMYEALKRAQPYLRTALKHGVYDHEINQIVFDVLAEIDGSG